MESLPPSILLVQVGATLVIVGILAKLRVRQPFQVSSMPAGAVFRPGILVIIEDIVAVDGGRGRLYRSALMERYTASSQFQSLIENLNWFWGCGGLVMGILLISILSSVHDQTFAWGLGKLSLSPPLLYVPIYLYPRAYVAFCIVRIFRTDIFPFSWTGWTIPWIWAGVWATITTYWVKSALRKERNTWANSLKRAEV